MNFDSKNPHYNPKDLIPYIDESGEFIDFALKTGHPIITDYSRIKRKIIVKDGFITLGEPKKKSQIKSIDELRKVLAKMLLQVYKAQLMAKDYVRYESLLSNPSSSQTQDDILSQLSSKHKDMWKYIIGQVMFDILYDKYRSDSPRLTLNDYCTNFILYDWDNSIYDLLQSENSNVTPVLHHECLKVALKEFTKAGGIMSEVTKNIAKIIMDCESLKGDCEKLGSDDDQRSSNIKVYLESLKTELAKKKKAAYNAMIEEINREIDVMSDATLKKNAEKLGVNPNLFFEYLDKRNASGQKDVKKPKYVWDYLYFNGCPELISSKQYKRNFKRDSNNSYQRFTDDFDRYDKFVEIMLPKDEDAGYEYFRKSMDFYHLEIYKRLDFIYRLASKLENTAPTTLGREYFLVKRFHPVVIWPDMDGQNNCPRYDERYKYYRPLLFIENYLMENDKLKDSLNFDALCEYNFVRAKIYELFTFHYEFYANDYNDISDFIRNHYNMQSYHTKNKEWYCMEYRKKRYKKMRIENVLMINNALFGKRK